MFATFALLAFDYVTRKFVYTSIYRIDVRIPLFSIADVLYT